MPRKRLLLLELTWELIELTEKTHIQAVWSYYVQKFRATLWLWHTEFFQLTSFFKGWKEASLTTVPLNIAINIIWDLCLRHRSKNLIQDPSAFLMIYFFLLTSLVTGSENKSLIQPKSMVKLPQTSEEQGCYLQSTSRLISTEWTPCSGLNWFV